MGESDLSTFGKRLKSARKAAKMSQEALATAAGITQPTVSQLEADHYDGSSYAPELAAALKVDALWLKTGKGSRKGAAHVDPVVLRDILIGIAAGGVTAPERVAELAAGIYPEMVETEGKSDTERLRRILQITLSKARK